MKLINIGGIYMGIKPRLDETGLKKSVGSAVDAVKKAAVPMAAAGGAITGALTAMVKSYANAGDAAAKMSARTGLSTDAIQELKHAAELSGTSIEGLEVAIKKMASFTQDAEKGLATQTETLKALGVGLEDIRGKSPEEVFNLLTEAIANVSDPLARAALAQDVFGKSGTDLLPMLAAGAEGIRAMRKEAHDLNLIISEENTKASEGLNDNLDRMLKGLTGVKNAIAEQLLPILLPLAEKLVEVTKNVVAWVKENPGLTKGIVLAVGGLGTLSLTIGSLILTFGPLIKAVVGVAKLFSGLGLTFKVIGGLAGTVTLPFTAVALALAGVLALIITYRDQIGAIIGEVFDMIGKIPIVGGALGLDATPQDIGNVSSSLEDAQARNREAKQRAASGSAAAASATPAAAGGGSTHIHVAQGNFHPTNDTVVHRNLATGLAPA